jgi:glycosyltransferase involved in cell wall biosynthesis
VVPNGLRPEEFDPIAAVADPRDFLFIGTLRDLKGPDVFIEALDHLRKRAGTAPTAAIVGAGDEKPRYEAMVGDCGLTRTTLFRDPMPARDAFALARAVVVPSRAESMPYIVLESVAAGMPTIATNVGGIPEIFGDASDRLVPAGDAKALADAMAAVLASPTEARAAADILKARIKPLFSVEAMATAIEGVYRVAAG